MIMAAEFETLGANVDNFEEPLKRSVEEVMAPSIRQNFNSGGRPSWAPLSNFTYIMKAARGHSSDTLVATGALSSRASSPDLWTISGAEGTAAIEGLPADIAHGLFHQTGFVNARTGKSVPAREWAVIQDEDANRIEEIFDEWLGQQIDKYIVSGGSGGGF